MTNDRELMQQALDALFTCQEDWVFDGEDERPTKTYDEKLVGAAFKALRARLAQPDCACDSPAWCKQYGKCHRAVVGFEPAQPKHEPVAKMREMLEVQGRDGNWNYDAYMQGMYNGMEFMVAIAERRDPVFRDPPEKWLHTPPQREWQGLTLDEIFDVWRESYGKNGVATDVFARAIEAKLKEKNA